MKPLSVEEIVFNDHCSLVREDLLWKQYLEILGDTWKYLEAPPWAPGKTGLDLKWKVGNWRQHLKADWRWRWCSCHRKDENQEAFRENLDLEECWNVENETIWDGSLAFTVADTDVGVRCGKKMGKDIVKGVENGGDWKDAGWGGLCALPVSPVFSGGNSHVSPARCPVTPLVARAAGSPPLSWLSGRWQTLACSHHLAASSPACSPPGLPPHWLPLQVVFQHHLFCPSLIAGHLILKNSPFLSGRSFTASITHATCSVL